MRTIKFRAWDKEGKEWLDDGIVRDSLWVILEDKQHAVMQFTGLKDKNRQEIYEGDICRNGDWEEDAHAYNYRVEEVKYNENEASFSGWNPNEDGMTCEVIGNIYENKDLLK